MNTDYSILGLEQGASQADIKKAYFKMVRLHSPESDPEQFQKIRQAYERLKNAKNKPDGPVFPPLSDPWAVKMMHQIQIYRNEKNMPLYRDACEEAWKKFPDDIQFLYLLIMAQRRCGNTGKAVKNAELLVSKDSKNPWFQMVLAFSYKERGFHQKAFKACKTAYELGCRDIDFLLMYASACDDNRLYSQAIPVLLDVVKQDKRWTREDISKPVEAYMGLIVFSVSCHSDMIGEALDMLYHFLEQYSIYTKEYLTKICFMLANTCTEIPYGTEEYKTVDHIFSFVLKTCQEESDKEIVCSSMELYYFQRVASDVRISQILIAYIELFHNLPDEIFDQEDEMLRKFSVTDLQLCMIENRQNILLQAAILEREHPQEYERISDFIQKLQNEPKLQLFKDSLLKTYRRLEPFFSGGEYYELYPEEKIKAMGTLINEGYENEPYVRTTKKIGRNDPCPCGSGKKYKHCCMNKK